MRYRAFQIHLRINVLGLIFAKIVDCSSENTIKLHQIFFREHFLDEVSIGERISS